MSTHDSGATYSRRKMLGLLGGAGLAMTSVGCNVSTDSDEPAPAGAKQVKIAFPDSDAIPSGDVTLRWMTYGDLQKLFEKPLLEAYEKQHSNVDITYDTTTVERVSEVIPLAVRNGTAPDVFSKPPAVPVQVAIQEGWIRPIDDIIPDFEKWKAGFPQAAFIEGVHSFDGRTYTFPFSTSKRWDSMMFFDPEYLKKAGFDPSEERLTWTTFRQACKEITRQGDGKYFGLMISAERLASIASTFAEMAGLHNAGGINWKTGEYTFAEPGLQEAIEWLRAIESDGSIFPGYLSMNRHEARGRMPQRVAGLFFDGAQPIPNWPVSDPGYEFDIAAPPMGDDKVFQPHSFAETGTGFIYVSKATKNAAVIGDIFSYIGSPDGQTNMILLSDGNLGSVMPGPNQRARDSNTLDPLAVKGIDIAEELVRAAPMVEVRNGDAGMVTLKMEKVTPTLQEIVEGVFSGQIDDLAGALTKLNDASEKNLDDAIRAAQREGAHITRDDWVFENWDPSKDYTVADYESLPR